MKAKEIGKWLMAGLQWGTGFYIFSIAGIYLATEWGRSPLFARRATLTGFIFYILIVIILVILAAVWRAGREKKPPRGFLSSLLFWGGLSVPGSTVAFVLSALCFYLAGLVVGARLPVLSAMNWIVAWLIALVPAILKVILTIGTFPSCPKASAEDTGGGGGPAPGQG